MGHNKIVIFVLLTFFPGITFSQITFNPGTLIIDVVNPPNYFEEPSGVQVFVHAENNWQITCSVTELVGFSSGHIITPERISVRHNYSGGSYHLLNTKINIAEGLGTGGPTLLINTLFLRVQVLETDIADTYHGELRFQDELNLLEDVVLPFQLNIQANMQLSFSAASVSLDVTGAPGIYETENSVQLSVNGNTSDWQIQAEVISITGPSYIDKSKIFIKSSSLNFSTDQGSGEGYQSLSYKKEILNGSTLGIGGNSDLNFILKTDYNLPPGDYSARINISSKQIQPQIINLEINICEYVEVGFSEGSEPEVNIYSDGPPGEYESSDPLTLEVAANTNWEAFAEAENLKSDRDEIPAKRIYLFSSNLSHLGYQSLGSSKIIASGLPLERAKTSDLKVRVETKIDDIAGEYSGKIIITILAIL